MERITSRENQNIKRAVKLMQSRKERVCSGCFVAEGIKLCAEAAAGGIAVRELYITPEAMEKYADKLPKLVSAAGAVFEITADLARKIGDTQAPQGVYCVCETPPPALQEGAIPPGRFLALESLQDPGNLGTILRSADAFGADGVILTEDCPEVFSPKVLRSTMGSAFRVPVCVTVDLPGLLNRLSATHATYAATLSERAVSVRGCEFPLSAVVVIGSEGGGLTRETVDACTQNIIIDMAGRAESLNAGVAASILLWELAGKRHAFE